MGCASDAHGRTAGMRTQTNQITTIAKQMVTQVPVTAAARLRGTARTSPALPKNVPIRKKRAAVPPTQLILVSSSSEPSR
jgi:hypothetical protein